MGKVTGFLEFDRPSSKYAPVAERLKHCANSSLPLREEDTQGPGRALHGLRHSVLPHRLPGQQPDPGLERPRLSRRLEAGARATCTRPTTSRSSPAASARRRAKRPARSTSTTMPVTIKTIECAIVDRGLGGRLDRAGAAGDRRPASASPSSARAPRASPPPSSSRAPATTSTSTRRTPSAGGLLRYGIPDFKMEKGIIDRRVKQMEAEGVTFHCNVHVGSDDARPRSSSDGYDAVLLAGGAEQPRDFCQVPGRDLDGIHFAMDFLPQQNRRVAGEGRRRRRRRSWPRASTSSSSAAATPARTASARRTARAPSR